MTLSKRVLLIVALMLIALVSAACSGGGDSGGGRGRASDAAYAFIDATFKGEFNALRNAVCEARRGELTAEQEAEITAGLQAMGGAGSIDSSGITYTFNSESNTVTLGGTIKVTVQGTTVDAPVDAMFAEGLPVLQEGGSWKVCPTNILGG